MFLNQYCEFLYCLGKKKEKEKKERKEITEVTISVLGLDIGVTEEVPSKVTRICWKGHNPLCVL